MSGPCVDGLRWRATVCAVVAVALAALPAGAQWVSAPSEPLSPNRGENSLAFMLAGAVQTAPGVVTLWTRVMIRGSAPRTRYFGAYVVLTDVDCVKKRTRSWFETSYDSTNTFLSSRQWETGSNWSSYPISVGLIESVCTSAMDAAPLGSIADLLPELAPSRWRLIAVATIGDSVSVDMQTLERRAPLTRAWVRTRLGVRDTVGDKVVVATTDEVEVNCTTRASRRVSGTSRDARGTVIDTWRRAYPAFRRPTPESMGEGILTQLCRPNGPELLRPVGPRGPEVR